MSDRLPNVRTLTWLALTVLPLVVLLGIVLLMLRAQPKMAPDPKGGRRKTHVARGLPLDGEPHGVNVLGNYAGEGVSGPDMSMVEDYEPSPEELKDFQGTAEQRAALVAGLKAAHRRSAYHEAVDLYRARVERIILPQVDIHDQSLPEVVSYLTKISREADPEHLGIQLDLDMNETEKNRPQYRVGEYHVKNIPAVSVLHEILSGHGLSLRMESDSISIYADE